MKYIDNMVLINGVDFLLSALSSPIVNEQHCAATKRAAEELEELNA